MDLSGLERDKLFLNSSGVAFLDVSYLSGTDNVHDGRAFAYADLDHDGAMDFILVNRDAPLLRIYHNVMRQGNWISLQLQGDGNRNSYDPAGARVTAFCGNNSVTRLIEIGSGFGVQNTSTLQIGLGSCNQVDKLEVQWPHGSIQTFQGVKANEYYEVVKDKDLVMMPHYYKSSDASSPP